MVHEPTLDRPSLVQGLLQGIQYKAGVRSARHAPADNAPGKGVDHEGDIDEARPGRDVGEVADPQRVRPQGPELAVDPVERARRGLVADRCPDRLAPDRPLQARGPHQARDGAAGDRDPLSAELPPDLAHPIDPEVLLEDAPDLNLEPRVAPGSRRQLARISPSRGMGAVGRRGDRQHAADRLDPVDGTVRIDERNHGLDRRSSSAIAK